MKPVKPKEPDSDVEVVAEDDETFTAKLFGGDEAFVFHKDVNFLMLLIAYGGGGEDLGSLSPVLKSLFYVETDSDDERRETWQRFLGELSAQRGMDAERSMKFINDLVAAAGKDPSESSDV